MQETQIHKEEFIRYKEISDVNSSASNIIDGATTALINSNYKADSNYVPKLIYNNVNMGNTVLSVISKELSLCDSFWFSVAFITKGGLITIKETLKELNEKGVHGRILTTDYLNFNEPNALRELLGFNNIEVRVYTQEFFHTKGYMFKKNDVNTFIVGSSNLTQNALKKTKEWNLKITSLDNGELIKETDEEFEMMWKDADVLTNQWIDNYEIEYKQSKNARSREKVNRLKTYTLKPNKMQVEAVRSLAKLRTENKDKALLISATGTGKTYLSAFDVRNFKPKKLLFLVHREQILKKAEESFKDVLGEGIDSGILSGNSKEYNADYLFSTVQTMSKDDVLSRYDKSYFDYIIIDETHKAGSSSYQKIISYFEPKFLLGMSATPERNDGIDIYSIFDHNIAYEIRLQQAMEEDMLCPFHYFGISELTINGESIDEKTEFNNLVCEERVNNIIKQIEFYGYSGDRVRGLIFCSRKDEAKELSNLFNKRGYRTVALTGDTNQSIRDDAINRLEQDENEGALDYIFTVDIFNEGVDIPSINQIVMLRPTESSIIFIQQLGRGLRKHKDKEYVVIIDFIGNYQKNFLIPIALSGDRTYNKDTLRKYILSGNRIIPGCSTINFDRISKKKIYAAIDNASFSDVKLLKENYFNLKYKLGRIPKLSEFDEYGEMDVLRIFENDNIGSYYKFLVKYDKEYKVRLNKEEEKTIEFISKKLSNGKRIYELELLSIMMEHNNIKLIECLKNNLKEKYNIQMKEYEVNNVVNIMTNKFATGASKKTYELCIFLKENDNDYKISDEFSRMLENEEFFKIIKEVVEFGISRYYRDYSNTYQDTLFVLYKKYTYEDVCRLLGWDHNEVPLNIGGYKFDKETKTFPVFINYEKDENISETIKYEDHFINNNSLIAISKSGRSIESEDVQNFINAKERGIDVHLFVRKNKDDKISKEFYYLGRMEASGKLKEFNMINTSKTAVEIEWILDTPVREDIYEYIIS